MPASLQLYRLEGTDHPRVDLTLEESAVLRELVVANERSDWGVFREVLRRRTDWLAEVCINCAMHGRLVDGPVPGLPLKYSTPRALSFMRQLVPELRMIVSSAPAERVVHPGLGGARGRAAQALALTALLARERDFSLSCCRAIARAVAAWPDTPACMALMTLLMDDPSLLQEAMPTEVAPGGFLRTALLQELRRPSPDPYAVRLSGFLPAGPKLASAVLKRAAGRGSVHAVIALTRLGDQRAEPILQEMVALNTQLDVVVNGIKWLNNSRSLRTELTNLICTARVNRSTVEAFVRVLEESKAADAPEHLYRIARFGIASPTGKFLNFSVPAELRRAPGRRGALTVAAAKLTGIAWAKWAHGLAIVGSVDVESVERLRRISSGQGPPGERREAALALAHLYRQGQVPNVTALLDEWDRNDAEEWGGRPGLARSWPLILQVAKIGYGGREDPDIGRRLMGWFNQVPRSYSDVRSGILSAMGALGAEPVLAYLMVLRRTLPRTGPDAYGETWVSCQEAIAQLLGRGIALKKEK